MRHLRALDGLRGVAVAAVVLFHFLPGDVPGGFLGVDIFFVLSGYLITSLVLHEATATRRFDIGRFWIRRARRLLPALVLVLVAIAAYAAWVATPGELSRLRAHGLATLGYFANWQYIAEGVSYTDLVLGASPLVHTWSLAIEEQFYLVFPAVALLAMWGARRDPVRLRWIIGVVAVVGAVVSATAMALVHQPGTDPSRVYYGTDTRIHVLLVGVLLGVVFTGTPPSHGRAASVFAAVGAVAGAALLVAFATVHDTDTWLYEGGFLATALIVAAVIGGSRRSRVLGPLLSTRPLVGLGLISYGVYLWHWPVLVVLDEQQTGLRDAPLFTLRVAVTLAIAVTSYALVEQPIRRGVLGQRLGRGAVVVTPVTAVVVVALLVPATALPPIRTEGAAADLRSIATLPVSQPAVRAVLAGDSVMHTLAGGEVYEFPNFGPWDPSKSPYDPARVEIWNAARPACAYLPGKVALPRAGGGYDAYELFHDPCGDWRSDIATVIAQLRSDFLVVLLTNEMLDREINGELVEFGTPAHDRLLAALFDEFGALAAAGEADLVLLTPPPRVGATAGEHDVGGWRERHLQTFIRSYAAQTGVYVVDLAEEICPGADCDRPERGFDPGMRYDGLHFTADGARWVATWMTTELERLHRARESQTVAAAAP